MKTCFKCKAEKPLSGFYKHGQMADGHLNKCKECTKLDVKIHSAKPEVRRRQCAYDRTRNQRPERKAQRLVTQQKRRLLYPQKAKAWRDTSRAIHKGKLIRQPCEVCGNALAQAHHPDYSSSLAVRWLCFEHHRAVHGQRMRQEAA